MGSRKKGPGRKLEKEGKVASHYRFRDENKRLTRVQGAREAEKTKK